jgi:hypothetical protein
VKISEGEVEERPEEDIKQSTVMYCVFYAVGAPKIYLEWLV